MILKDTILRVWVTDNNHIAVQEALFRMGYGWSGGKTKIAQKWASNRYILLNADKSLQHGTRKNHDSPEFSVPTTVTNDGAE